MSLKIVGILLAAGNSSRMGDHKLALPLGSSNIGSLCLTSAVQSMLDYVLVVKKPEDSLTWIDPILKKGDWKRRWTVCTSENAQLGQAYSLKAGVLEAIEQEADALVLLLGDQPFMSTDVVNELIYTYRRAIGLEECPGFIAFENGGLRQPPVLFANFVFTELVKLTGDEGARQLIRNHQNTGITIPSTNQLAFFDIDTQEDYQKALIEGRKIL
ncbi:nucleotidyltransferase family protein [Mesobacillus maritimus]|uniref:NTP transferase domain-containing protein n=1 Tax=Mesobacillus maritimus TaxID=1643336 RepID=A0ABS7K0H8_9BACI|nr:nucleotidyltransferase family protein [Mesobacillus maritimus]MBY0095754.1 NTP transferase domain-containing protein [Mesobacillus maritimus]